VTAKGVVQKIASWATVANLQDDRIRQQPDGQIFNTITHGKNTMGAYGPNIAVEDRWAIVAYVSALQKSQRAQLADLPPDKQKGTSASATK
jgi:mono/diheme cytochrome c family protein